MTHEDFMRRAIKLAARNVESGNGGPFGAVIVKDGIVVAEACNEVTSRNDPTAHAEVQAIRKACEKLGTFQLNGCVIYTSCEPCPMCIGAIYWARPDAVYYASTKAEAAAIGFDDHFIYDEIEKPVAARSLPMIELRPDGYSKPFEAWASSTFKREY